MSDSESEQQDRPRCKRTWTPVEDAAILRLVEIHGPSNWSIIAEGTPGRTGKQCRERYHNHLQPNIKKGEWSEEEDRKIIYLQAKYGNQWAKITKELPGRTDNAVKNRWHAAMRSQMRNMEQMKREPLAHISNTGNCRSVIPSLPIQHDSNCVGDGNPSTGNNIRKYSPRFQNDMELSTKIDLNLASHGHHLHSHDTPNSARSEYYENDDDEEYTPVSKRSPAMRNRKYLAGTRKRRNAAKKTTVDTVSAIGIAGSAAVNDAEDSKPFDADAPGFDLFLSCRSKENVPHMSIEGRAPSSIADCEWWVHNWDVLDITADTMNANAALFKPKGILDVPVNSLASTLNGTTFDNDEEVAVVGNLDDGSVTTCEADTESNCSDSEDISPTNMKLLQQLHVGSARSDKSKKVSDKVVTAPSSSSHNGARKADRVITTITTDSFDIMAVNTEDHMLFDPMDISPRFAQLAVSVAANSEPLNDGTKHNVVSYSINERRSLSSLILSPKLSPMYKKQRSGSIFNRRSTFFTQDRDDGEAYTSTTDLSDDDIDALYGICVASH